MKKKIIVITGASSGIGESTAKLLAEQGHKIVLGARRENRLKELSATINKSGESTYEVTDVTSLESTNKLAKKAIDTFGGIDVWINAAGLMPQSPFIEGRVKDWNNMIDVNIKGVLNGIESSLKTMRKQASGQYINIASIAAHKTHANGGVYSATKTAVWMISDALRQEEAAAKSGIRVTTVSPGAINTELVSNVTDEKVKKNMEKFYNEFAISPDRVAKVISSTINMPEDTTINEIIIRPTDQVS